MNMIEINTEIDLDEADIKKLRALAQNLVKQKKQKQEQEYVPPENRVYVMRITKDSIMTTKADNLALIMMGKKESESICRQLELRHGHKFYLEEATYFDKRNLIN